MSETHVYEYTLVRVMPRVEREEFLNVGAIVYCKRKRFLEIQYQLIETRLKAFAPDLDLEMLEEYLQAWDWICQGRKQGGPIARLDRPERFRWLSATKSTILQCSKVHPGLCVEPKAVLEEVMEKYVL